MYMNTCFNKITKPRKQTHGKHTKRNLSLTSCYSPTSSKKQNKKQDISPAANNISHVTTEYGLLTRRRPWRSYHKNTAINFGEKDLSILILTPPYFVVTKSEYSLSTSTRDGFYCVTKPEMSWTCYYHFISVPSGFTGEEIKTGADGGRFKS